jgi:hypothetical protein
MYGFLMGRGEGEYRALRVESNSCTHLIKRQNRQATTRSPDTEKKKIIVQADGKLHGLSEVQDRSDQAQEGLIRTQEQILALVPKFTRFHSFATHYYINGIKLHFLRLHGDKFQSHFARRCYPTFTPNWDFWHVCFMPCLDVEFRRKRR